MMEDDEFTYSSPKKMAVAAFSDLKKEKLTKLYSDYGVKENDQKDLENAILEVLAECLF